MNIAFIVSSLSYGGAEKQAVLDANMLADRNDYNVWLGFFENGGLRDLVEDNIKKNLKVKSFGSYNYVTTPLKLRQFLKQNKIHIVHASLFSPMIISALASIRSNTKVLWAFHSHEYDMPLRIKLAFKYLSRFSCVKKLLFVSKELIEHFNKEGLAFKKNKIEILFNSSRIKQIKPKIRYLNKDRFIIGFVGRVIKLKRIAYLIDLALFLKQNKYKFQIRIIGDGNERITLEKQVTKKNLEDCIIFYGFQPETVKYYKGFDIFILPSEEECLSLALIDAGMMGIPSIAFDVGGNKEIVKNGKTGFIVKDKNEMLEKVILLIKDHSLYKSMSEQSKIHCGELFSEDSHLKKLTAIYEELNNRAT